MTDYFSLDAIDSHQYDEHSHYIESKLELKQLSNTVINVTALDDSLDDRGEVII